MNTLRYVAGGICITLGVFIFFVHTDRQFINLTPGEGPGLLQTIRSESAYEQTFISRGQIISKIGTYLVPVHTNAKISPGVIHVDLFTGNEKKATVDIPVPLIDSNGPTLVRVLVPTKKGEVLTIKITASPEASGLIAMQKRPFDESFSRDAVEFFIDGAIQEYAIAHAVFEKIHPPFVQQLGGILCAMGLVILLWNTIRFAKNAATIALLVLFAVLYAIPSFGTFPLFAPLVVFLMVACWILLRIAGRTIAAASFGACIFSCSTWLPLYFITGGSAEGILSVRDALIDPNQVSVSHGAGGYVGIPGVLFAGIGICMLVYALAKRRFVAVQADNLICILFLASLFVTFIPSPLHHYKAIILVVFCIAWFASFAFDKMQRFLGLRNMFVQTLLTILLLIFLLDLMNITARTFEYGLGL